MVPLVLELQGLLMRGLALFGVSFPKAQDILMLCWEEDQTREMLKYMIEHQDASPAMLYETALIISKSTRTEPGEDGVPNR